jgi:hypothetical protein
VPGHESTTDAVPGALGEVLVTGFLAPGTWLREDKVAKELGVSRTPATGTELSPMLNAEASILRGVIAARQGDLIYGARTLPAARLSVPSLLMVFSYGAANSGHS